jgi:hypothetical protein
VREETRKLIDAAGWSSAPPIKKPHYWPPSEGNVCTNSLDVIEATLEEHGAPSIFTESFCKGGTLRFPSSPGQGFSGGIYARHQPLIYAVLMPDAGTQTQGKIKRPRDMSELAATAGFNQCLRVESPPERS